MAFIKQRGSKDCGIAALAMLCDVTYEEAERAIPWKREGLLNGTDTKMLKRGAWKLGYDVQGTKTGRLIPLRGKSWDDIPDNSLVKIKGEAAGETLFHWVVWRNKKIYDPAVGVFRPRHYHDREPTSYMVFEEYNGVTLADYT